VRSGIARVCHIGADLDEEFGDTEDVSVDVETDGHEPVGLCRLCRTVLVAESRDDAIEV
jgi:hypothetical protein